MGSVAKIGSKLEDISFDASVGENRAKMAQLEDVIYLKQKAIRKLVTEDSWDKALKRIDTVMQATVNNRRFGFS